MGTPDFAVESLRGLVEGGYRMVGVVTMPDKAMNRHGSVLQPSAVKQYAVSQNIPVLQPEKLKNEGFLEELRALQADLQIVVAFRMLPEVVWNMPRFGTFNLHASLLPQYRGAAPINWAIINGEKETGVTTFFLTHEIDTGKIILQRKLPVAGTDDAGIVHDALMQMGARLVTETVDLLIEKNGYPETVSQQTICSHLNDLQVAPKIFIDTCRIDWRQPAIKVYNFIRGLSPYPGAWTEIVNPAGGTSSAGASSAGVSAISTSATSTSATAGASATGILSASAPTGGHTTSLKIFVSQKREILHDYPPGVVQTDGKTYLDVAVTDGFIRILSLQLAGKKRMSVKDFLNGAKIDDGWKVK